MIDEGVPSLNFQLGRADRDSWGTISTFVGLPIKRAAPTFVTSLLASSSPETQDEVLFEPQ
jgi:hypothetical protein